MYFVVSFRDGSTDGYLKEFSQWWLEKTFSLVESFKKYCSFTMLPVYSENYI